jgi:hypothetical protein
MTKASSLRNPNAGKTANKGIRKSLANPTSTQKQFQARNKSTMKRSGGFGRSTGSSTGRSTVSRSSARRSGGFGRSTARSVRSFGGGGFGGGGK